MKPLIFILLIFCSFVSYSQTSFSDTLEGNGKRIIFKTDNSFEYYYDINSITSSSHYDAKGIYNLNNNKLILVFDEPKQSNDSIISPPYETTSPSYPSTYNVQNINCDSVDKINLKFHVVDIENKPLTGATILLLGLGKGANVKEDGSAKFKNIEYNQNLKVNIRYIGYENYKFEIFTDSCKFIEIIMSEKAFRDVIACWFKVPVLKTLIFDVGDKIQNENCNYLINKNKTMMLIEDYTDYFE